MVLYETFHGGLWNACDKQLVWIGYLSVSSLEWPCENLWCYCHLSNTEGDTQSFEVICS